MYEHLLRTFFAVPVPEAVLPLQEKLKLTLSSVKGNIKWVRPSMLHLTLKFLGHTPPESVKDIKKVIEDVVQDQKPIHMEISGTGCFPKIERPRVLWLGMNGETESLTSLVKNLHSRLEPLGFYPEEKSFIPHLTLARIKYPQKHTPDITSYLSKKYESISFKINKVQFISSELFPNGPVYTILGSHFFNHK